MTDPAVPEPAPAAPAPALAANGPAPALAAEPVRKWRRRLRRVAIGLFVLLVAARLTVVAAAPTIIDKQLRKIGLTCTIGRLELALLSGELELANLTIAPAEGGEPLVALGYLRADVSILALLRGKVVVRRVELDGLSVLVDRDADGRLAIEKRIAAHVGSSTETEKKKEKPEEKKSSGDDSPPSVLIEALRVSHVHVHWRDKSVEPPLDARLEVDLRVLDLALDALPTKRPANVELQVSCPPVLDSLRVEGELTSDGKADLSVALDHLHLAPLAPYLAKARIRPYAKELSFGLGVTGRVQGTAAVFSMEHVALKADGHEELALDTLAVLVRSVSKDRIEIEKVLVDGIRADLVHQPDASFRVAGLELLPPKPEPGPPPEEPPPEAEAPSGPGPKLVLDELAITNVKAGFTDEETKADLSLLLESLALRGVDARDPAKKATLSLRLAAPGVIERITVEGEATPFAAAPALRAQVRGERMTLRALAPYLKKAGVESLLQDGELRLTLTAKGRAGRALEADVTLSDARFLEGERVLAGVDAVRIKDFKIDPEENHIWIAGVRVEAPRLAPIEKDRSGALVVCGLRITPEVPGATPVPAPVEEKKPLPAPSGKVGKPLHLELGSLVVEKIAASFHDESVSPVASLGISDAGLTLGAIDLDLAPGAKKPAPTALHAWLASPGVIESVDVTGALVASAREPSLVLALDAKGVTARAAARYLAKAGVESRLEKGRLELALRAEATIDPAGPLGASFALEKARFSDGEREHFLLENLHVDGVRLDVKKLDRVEVALVALDRVKTDATTGKGGVLDAFGLHVSPVASDEEEPPPEKKDEPGPQPLVVLKKLKVGEVAFDLHEGSEEPAFLVPLRAGVELGPLAFDSAGKAPLEDAPFRITLSAKEVVESLVVSGGLAVSPKAARLTGRVETTGITARALKERLAKKGIEPLLEAGAFHLGLDLAASFAGGDADATLHVKDVVYEETGAGKQELAGIDAIDVLGVHFTNGHLSIRDARVVHPRATAAKDGSGAIVGAGFRISPHAPQPPADPDAEEPPRKPAKKKRPKAGEKPAEKPAPFVISVDAFALTDQAFSWTDASVKPEAKVALSSSVKVTDFVFGSEDAKGATLALNFAAPGVLERGSLEGTVLTRPSVIAAKLALDLGGVRAGSLGGYLGAIRSELADGAFHTDIDARLEPHEGSVGLAFALEKLVWRDGPAVLLELDALRVKAPELGESALNVSELSLEGLATRIEKSPAGEMRLLGLVLPAETKAPETKPAETKPPEAKAPETKPGKRAKPPLIALERLHLNVKELSFHDRSQKGSAPLVVSDLHVTNPKPIRLLGQDPASQPAIELRLATALAPIASSIVVETRLAPFALEPDFAVSLAIDGLRGAGLTKVAPALEKKLDGSQLTDGRVRASVSLELRTGRRDPLDFSALSNAFGVDLLVKGVEVREGAAGRVLAGLDELHADVARIDSAGGVHMRALEIARPAGWIQKEKDGLRVLDILLKSPPPEPAPITTTTTTPTTTGASDKTPKPEIRVDRISLTDIAFTFADVSTETSMVVPLTGLDVNVSQLTTKALDEHRAIRFDAVVKAGKIVLPKHAKKDAIPGTTALLEVLGDVAHVVGVGEKKTPELEERRAFQEIAVKGELTLVPNLEGSIDATVEGLELANFKGPAKNVGVTLEDGVFDLDAKLRWNALGDLDAKVSATFTDLDISEPKNGFVQSHLPGLKAPLNVVTFVLRDEEGTIEIPIDVKLPGLPAEMAPVEKLARMAPNLWLAVSKAFVEIAMRAVLRSPFRVLGSAADLTKGVVGLIPGSDLLNVFDKPKVALDPVVLRFEPGDPVASSAELARLKELVSKLKDDDKLVVTLRHTTGGGDLARERVAANPSPRDRRDILARLSARRADLERERLAAQAEERAALGAGLAADATAARERVKNLETELSTVERARDQVYELERDGAERQAERRTRAACVDLAKARLEAVREAIAKGLPADQAERVRVSRPRVEEATGLEGGSITATVSASRKR